MASRNEATIRSETRLQLDEALRCLGLFRTACEVNNTSESVAMIDRLLRQGEFVRDQVASGYDPSPANLKHPRRHDVLDMLDATEIFRRDCEALLSPEKKGVPILKELTMIEGDLKQFEIRRIQFP